MSDVEHGVEPRLSPLVDKTADFIFEKMVPYLLGRRLTASDDDMHYALDLLEKYHDIYSPDAKSRISELLSSVRGALEEYASATNFLQAWRAARAYKVGTKVLREFAEEESGQARRDGHTAYQFVETENDVEKDPDNFTADEVEDIRSQVFEITLEFSQIVAEEGTLVEDDVIDAVSDAGKPIAPAIDDSHAKSEMPAADKVDVVHADEKTIGSAGEF
ncbi:hypothetical protein EVG20_g9480 [Dentipellis fragilis]|uniref:Uncharacterized protein n=1 Tax=Dentipellis fragilis TaxID=205917 RepID=A0A4Y9XYX6_9AGAM|nr:hypothetical protein EVG20_g9480 [Dentipellis fragilis]